MKRIVIALGLALLAAPAFAAGPAVEESTKAAASLSADDFVRQASIGGMFEIESSKLALQRSKNAKLREFAQMMVSDHQKAAAKLKQVHPGGAAQQLDDTHAQIIARLKAADVATFDTLYVAEQTAAHQQAVTLFEGYAKGGDDRALKAYAAATLPTLKAHLDAVKKLN